MVICTTTVLKVVDIARQNKERVNRLTNCHFFVPVYEREIFNNGDDDHNYTKLTLLTNKKIDLTVKN